VNNFPRAVHPKAQSPQRKPQSKRSLPFSSFVPFGGDITSEFAGLSLLRIGKLTLLAARQADFFDSSQGFALYGSPDTPSLSILIAFDY